jgi:hypothetical protein
MLDFTKNTQILSSFTTRFGLRAPARTDHKRKAEFVTQDAKVYSKLCHEAATSKDHTRRG